MIVHPFPALFPKQSACFFLQLSLLGKWFEITQRLLPLVRSQHPLLPHQRRPQPQPLPHAPR